jgi:hypothetical protein
VLCTCSFSVVTWLPFAASLVHSLAWPTGVVAVITILRKPIGTALNHGVRRVRAGPVEVEFEQELAEVRQELRSSPELAYAPAPKGDISVAEELAPLADLSPRAAVLEAFARVEWQLRDRVRGIADVSDRATGGKMALLARNQKLISEETFRAFEGLALLRNLATHSQDEQISSARAREYVALANAVLYALGDKPAVPEPRPG